MLTLVHYPTPRGNKNRFYGRPKPVWTLNGAGARLLALANLPGGIVLKVFAVTQMEQRTEGPRLRQPLRPIAQSRTLWLTSTKVRPANRTSNKIYFISTKNILNICHDSSFRPRARSWWRFRLDSWKMSLILLLPFYPYFLFRQKVGCKHAYFLKFSLKIYVILCLSCGLKCCLQVVFPNFELLRQRKESPAFRLVTSILISVHFCFFNTNTHNKTKQWNSSSIVYSSSVNV